MLPAPGAGGDGLATVGDGKGVRREGLGFVRRIFTAAAVGDYRLRRHSVDLGSGSLMGISECTGEGISK